MTLVDSTPKQSSPRFKLELEQELQFTKLLIDLVPDAVFCVDSNARFLYVNVVACDLAGYSREELLSMTMHDVNPNFEAEVWLDYWETIKQQGSLTFESLHRTKQGWSFPVEVTVKHLEYYGREYGCVFVRDITKRKQLEVALQSSNEALEASEVSRTSTLNQAKEQLCCDEEIRTTLQQEECSQQKAHFVSMVAHEFRNPLNIVSFSTSLLKRHSHQWTEEKKRSYLDRIQTAVEQVSHLMDEVLTIGKAEAGKLTFEPKQFNLDQFCRELVAQMQQSNTSQHNVTFVSRGNCKEVCVDRKLLQPILTNLLENAIKYSPTGSTVNLELCCRKGEVIFQIKNRGIGIPATDLQRLFEPFHRGRNVGDIPGSGLGLAVVKKLVEIHGGQITVASEVGIGTTFTVVLP
jgi:PAS domain S-box-containing protein